MEDIDSLESDEEPFDVKAEVNRLVARIKATVPPPLSRIEEFPSQRQR